jgi:hypothetical protein
MSVTALACAASVPVAVAANTPGWAVASLGAGAAVAQGSQQVLQDQRLGTESHALAVLLSQAARKFRYKAGGMTDLRLRKVFNDFVDDVERILDTHGVGLLDIMRQAPVSDQSSRR